MPDNVLRVGAEFDVSPIVDGAKKAGDAIKNLNNDIAQQAARFASTGVTGNELVNVLQNLGYSAKEAQAAVASLGLAEEATTAQTVAATTAMSGFERAAALAGGRLLGMEAGLGMAGGAIARVAAFLPGLGTAFVLALPVALISDIVDKVEQYEEKLQKADRAIKEFAIDSDEMAASVEKENLKLEDQILKLERRPERNTLRIALIEAQEAAEKLSKSLETDVQKANDLLSVGIGGAIFSLFTGGGRADEKQYAEKVEPIINQIKDARQKLAELPTGAPAGQVNEVLKEEIALYKQLQTVLEDSIRDMEAGQGSSQIHAKSIADFKEELIGATNAVKTLGEQEVQTDLIVTKGVEEGKKNILDYWKEYSVGFARAAEELAKHDAMWKKFYSEQTSEAAKSVRERSTLEEDGARRMAEIMAGITERTTSVNIENAKAEAAAVEEVLRKMQEDRTAATQGHTGVFAEVINRDVTEKQLAELDTQIKNVEQTITRLKGDMAAIASQPFISAADTKSIERYTEELRSMESLLQKLQTEHTKLKGAATTTWQDIAKAEEGALNAGFNTFNSQFVRMMQSTESFSKVAISAWNSMVGSFVTAVLKMGEQWVATEILKLETTTTTNTTITAQTLSQNLVQRFDNAKTAASKAMASTPFPLDLVVGPLVFAAALAFQQGGIVPGGSSAMVPAIVHGGEMVLPPHISVGLQHMIAGSSTSNSNSTRINMENHFHGALGRDNLSDVARSVRLAVRRGMLKP